MTKQPFGKRALCIVIAMTMVFSIWGTTQSSVIAGVRTGAWVDTSRSSPAPGWFRFIGISRY